MDIELYIYTEATKMAMQHNQVVGGDREYYVTLYQLEQIIKDAQQREG